MKVIFSPFVTPPVHLCDCYIFRLDSLNIPSNTENETFIFSFYFICYLFSFVCFTIYNIKFNKIKCAKQSDGMKGQKYGNKYEELLFLNIEQLNNRPINDHHRSFNTDAYCILYLFRNLFHDFCLRLCCHRQFCIQVIQIVEPSLIARITIIFIFHTLCI